MAMTNMIQVALLLKRTMHCNKEELYLDIQTLKLQTNFVIKIKNLLQ